MKHEDSGRRMKEEWIMEILRVSAVLLHVMFMKLYFSRAIFLYEVVMIRQQGSMCVMRTLGLYVYKAAHHGPLPKSVVSEPYHWIDLIKNQKCLSLVCLFEYRPWRQSNFTSY